MPSQVVRVDSLRSLAAASISGTYNPVGGSFTHQIRLVKIVNNTNGDLTISYDGSTDNDFVPAGGFTLYDFTTNRVSSEGTFVFQPGTQVYAKGTPSTGSCYVVAVFGRGE